MVSPIERLINLLFVRVVFSLQWWEFISCLFVPFFVWLYKSEGDVIRRLFNGFQPFTYKLFCYKSISLKSATLAQQVNLDQDIVANVWICFQCCTGKQWEWEDGWLVGFKLVFLILRCDSNIQNCSFLTRIYIVSVVWQITLLEWSVPFPCKKSRIHSAVLGFS